MTLYRQMHAAFAAYLAVRKAGGRSSVKLRRVIVLTRRYVRERKPYQESET